MSGHITTGRIIVQDFKTGCDLARADGVAIAIELSRHDAKRLAACWNALEGLSTEAIEEFQGIGDLSKVALHFRDERNQAQDEAANVGASLASAEQFLAERDKTIARLRERIKFDAEILHDTLTGNQAAWIEWQRGAGAGAAMAWIQNGLAGVGVPAADAPWANEAQAWFDANKAEPFPTCFCGRPSNTATMDRGFCSWKHHDEWKKKEDAEARGLTGLPMFDGCSPDTEGGSCD